MKNLKVILVLIIGIIGGILIDKFILIQDPALVDPIKIQTTADAERLVNNFQPTIPQSYFFVTDDMVSQMSFVKGKVKGGVGFVVRMAATAQSDQYDLAIYSRYSKDAVGNLNEIEEYFKASQSRGTYGLCPPTCDIVGPLPNLITDVVELEVIEPEIPETEVPTE